MVLMFGSADYAAIYPDLLGKNEYGTYLSNLTTIRITNRSPAHP